MVDIKCMRGMLELYNYPFKLCSWFVSQILKYFDAKYVCCKMKDKDRWFDAVFKWFPLVLMLRERDFNIHANLSLSSLIFCKMKFCKEFKVKRGQKGFYAQPESSIFTTFQNSFKTFNYFLVHIQNYFQVPSTIPCT